MKKVFTAIMLCFAALAAVYGQSKGESLDAAIRNAALQIQDGLEARSTVIVYQFEPYKTRLEDYILKELFNLLVNSNKFISTKCLWVRILGC